MVLFCSSTLTHGPDQNCTRQQHPLLFQYPGRGCDSLYLSELCHYIGSYVSSNKTIRSVEGFLEINYGLYAYFRHMDLSFQEPMKARSSRQEQVTATFKKTNGEDSRTGGNQTAKEKLIWQPEKD